jgi:5'-3' exonuclease
LVTKLKKNSNLEIDILTADKDLHSLVCENVKIYDSLKKKLY